MLLCLETDEVTDPDTDWMLPPELEPGQRAATQSAPQAPLGIRLVRPQYACWGVIPPLVCRQ